MFGVFHRDAVNRPVARNSKEGREIELFELEQLWV